MPATSKPAAVHFELPAEKKGAYVRAARDAGQKLVPWIVAQLDAAAAQQPASVHYYYGIQSEGNGSTLWKFASRAERDAWAQANTVRRAPLAARDVQRTLNSREHYVRWARPEFIHQ